VEPLSDRAGSSTGLSALDLEDLLSEVRARADAAHQSQQRLSALLDAVVALSSDLDLPTVLGRIVRSACQLVDARYGALGVLEPGHEFLSEFITHGITDEERARIGDLPRGLGLLGLLIREPHPVRVREIAEHPDSYGFPPGHPPMGSFLGTPIRIRDNVFGNLYLAEKQGVAEFTDDDEAILVALAAAAGVVIENARLYDTARRQRQWSEAVAGMTQALLESPDSPLALSLMAERAGDLAAADVALVALYDEDGRLIIRAANGEPREAFVGRPLEEPFWSAGSGPHLVQPDEQERVASLRRLGGLGPSGPSVRLPIMVGESRLGVLFVAWDRGQETAAEAAAAALWQFTQQTALALAAAGAHQDRERAQLLEERDRIARDMHDHVIQRLFATGLSLQSATQLTDSEQLRIKLDFAVGELDAAIKDIRRAIFQLNRRGPAPDGE
jgi:signal transduction histidine kinase